MTATMGFKDDLDAFDVDDDFGGPSAFDIPSAPKSAPEVDRFVPAEVDPFGAPPSPTPSAAASPPVSNPVGALMAGVESALGEASVPRISIDIFCQRAETAEVAQKAAEDRRLSPRHHSSFVRWPGGSTGALPQPADAAP